MFIVLFFTKIYRSAVTFVWLKITSKFPFVAYRFLLLSLGSFHLFFDDNGGRVLLILYTNGSTCNENILDPPIVLTNRKHMGFYAEKEYFINNKNYRQI